MQRCGVGWRGESEKRKAERGTVWRGRGGLDTVNRMRFEVGLR